MGKPTALPTWESVNNKRNLGIILSPLELFIFHYEPFNPEKKKQWRDHLGYLLMLENIPLGKFSTEITEIEVIIPDR
jgi:hypothetical protein